MSNQIPRTNMITQQLRTGDVLDERILSLYETVSREAFVPDAYRPFAWSDMHIPLGHGECMMTPLEEALLLQSLALDGHESVLEVGTGSGFLTMMLSKLCKTVLSMDCHADFTRSAAARIAAHGCVNAELGTGDASGGWLAKAPYDVVIFTGALEKLTESHFLQVLPGGKLFALTGNTIIQQARLYTLSHEGEWNSKLVCETVLPMLASKLNRKVFEFGDNHP